MSSSPRFDLFAGGVAVGVSGATAETGLEGVYLHREAGDPGLIGAVGQAVTVYQLSRNICQAAQAGQEEIGAAAHGDELREAADRTGTGAGRGVAEGIARLRAGEW